MLFWLLKLRALFGTAAVGAGASWGLDSTTYNHISPQTAPPKIYPNPQVQKERENSSDLEILKKTQTRKCPRWELSQKRSKLRP